MVTVRHIAFWTDSFHEGEWAVKALAQHWKIISTDYIQGFVPQYQFEVRGDLQLVVTVFGSYRSWYPLPKPINELLGWGKPDTIVYDRDTDKIIMAMEETAAVPTGNQALQRCERLYGASRARIPFVYLLNEFGLHKDGGLRRASIWPTMQALKLTLQNGSAATVLLYGEKATPDSYDVGSGYASFAKILWLLLRSWLGEDVKSELEYELRDQYARMLAFIKSQWHEMSFFIPGEGLYEDRNGETSDRVALRAAGEPSDAALGPLGVWPLTIAIPRDVAAQQRPLTFRVPDRFLANISKLIVAKKAYGLSNNASSKPLPADKLAVAIELQRALFMMDKSVPRDRFSLDISRFPRTASGRHHIITALRIIMLCDRLDDVFGALDEAFGLSVVKKIPRDERGKATLLFVCNSITPGRFLGDPYTGQVAALVPIFSRDSFGEISRKTVAYYPHQAHYQLLEHFNEPAKGVQTIRELVDYAIFHAGIVVDAKSGAVL